MSSRPSRRSTRSRHRHGAASRPRVVSLLVVLAVTAGLLLVHGYTHGEFDADHRVHAPVSADHVPRAVLNGGPVIDTTGNRTRSHRLPDHTVALTFDDGPDPTWTPRILAVLDHYDVKGTFFVTGAATARRPGLVRQAVDAGHEIGVHTFTHPDLVYRSESQTDGELARTQLALAGAAGIHSSLVRPPYSSHAADLDDLSWPVVQRLGQKGYITSLVDIDTEDWQRPGAAAVAANVTGRLTGRGAVVLLHDAGGDRSQTVQALNILIPELKARGYRFTTVTGALGAGGVQSVSGAELWSGRVFVAAVAVSDRLVPALAVLMAAVGGLMLLRFAIMLVLAHRHARRRRAPGFSWGPEVTEPVSVVIPAYNESKCIAQTVLSVAGSGHPVEIVVVDDGSTDGTAEVVRALGLPGVTLLRQPNLGKAAALNNGVAHASYRLVVTMDGDTVFEPDTVHHLVQPLADRRVGAVAGNTKVGNRGRLLGTWQHLEYVMGLNLDRRMYDVLDCVPTVPGAVGAYRRTALRQVGGLSDDTLAEDTDLTMALHRAGWQVVYEEGARAWTEAPATVGQLWRQRYRWSYGTLQAMWKHRHALVERGHAGHFGRYGLVLVVLFTVLTPLLAPLIDLFLLYGLLFQDPARTAAAWGALIVVQLLCAAYALRLDGEKQRALWALPLQQLFYRQLLYTVLLQSCTTALTGARLRWHKLRRTGRVTAPAPPAPLPVPASVTLAPQPSSQWPSSPQPSSQQPSSPQPSSPTRASPAPAAPPPPVPPPPVPPPPVPTPAASAPARSGSGRNLYLDFLRAVALVRVVTYHTFDWAWLTLAFPAMGVMFALAGSLMARSLDRGDRSATAVVRARMRRLLPPVWLFGLVVVVAMLLSGWRPDDGGGSKAAAWARMGLWIVPVSEPPFAHTDWAWQIVAPLWYIRAYLLFVILSPLLLRVFRRAPWVAVGTCLVLAALAQSEVLPLPERVAEPFTDLVTFGACWLLGFAHHDGLVRRLPTARVTAAAVTLMAVGGGFALTHRTEEGYDLGAIPLGQALWSFGFVLLLLRFGPGGDRWVRRYRPVHAGVVLFNARAVTVYLWHEVALVLAVVLIDRMWRVPALENSLPLGATWFLYAMVWPLIAVAVLLTGWCEDRAARRPLRLWPRP